MDPTRQQALNAALDLARHRGGSTRVTDLLHDARKIEDYLRHTDGRPSEPKIRFHLPAAFIQKHRDVLNEENILAKGLQPGEFYRCFLDRPTPDAPGRIISLRVMPDEEGRLGLAPADKETERIVAEELQALGAAGVPHQNEAST